MGEGRRQAIERKQAGRKMVIWPGRYAVRLRIGLWAAFGTPRQTQFALVAATAYASRQTSQAWHGCKEVLFHSWL